MDESEFEGTLVLEKISEIGKLDEFFAAMDADDFKSAVLLMRRAGVDSETIQLVLQKMNDGEI
ncbi:MAG: hypothetical protein K2Q26_15365 [Bdellovibrionales bacterium]|nr:hypothetical protein [Bdellovibrionales bacterium]